MVTLSRELRKEFERAVIKARRSAEDGARKALESLAVHHHEPWGSLTVDQRNLRNRLRIHGRQLGDELDQKRGTQSISHLITETAYEQWHRMLFARFLAESNLLIEPDSNMSITFDECIQLARDRSCDWLGLASDFAVRMLPQIFRAGDPVLEVSFPPEVRQELEGLLKSLARDVFIADDSLGWVYQFWQTERKKQVNESEVEIGADELPAVTQLFTEDYMVLFLLHNTLGAWWTAKRKSAGKSFILPGYEWTYLRLKDDGMPAAGSFDGWPHAAKDLKILDPCMGSGHFLVFALPILIAFRMEEEELSLEEAVEAVLRDNLFGLEIDPRCTQIAAFNLGLAAWRLLGYRQIPSLNLACSGLGINAKEEDWLMLAGKDDRLRATMKTLYALFGEAPILGSLIDPNQARENLFAAEFAQVRPLLEQALAAEQRDKPTTDELSVTAKGLLACTRILAERFTLVVTNVPYLGIEKQNNTLKLHCQEYYRDAKHDIATSFLDRCLHLCCPQGSVAMVILQNCLFLKTYGSFRQSLLRHFRWDFVVRLGAKAFKTPMWDFGVILLAITNSPPLADSRFAGLDVGEVKSPDEKANALHSATVSVVSQEKQLANPNYVITFENTGNAALLSSFASINYGSKPGQTDRVIRLFWEFPFCSEKWQFLESTPSGRTPYSGKEKVCLSLAEIGIQHISEFGVRSADIWGKKGIQISQMHDMPYSLYLGNIFDNNTSVICATVESNLPAILAFVQSGEYVKAVRKLNQKLDVAAHTMVDVPFDLKYWQGVVAEKHLNILPKPYSSDPTQCIFNGLPCGSDNPLQVAVARLIGYQWPRQTGSCFPDCPALDPDDLQSHADSDGIVCLSSLKGKPPAADRLRTLLADAYEGEWSPAKQAELLAQVGFTGKTLEEWLRDGFFKHHCEVFNRRPFIWHIWDGLKDGFHAFVNYHKLAAPKPEGRKTLEKLIYTYLGDWINRQSADQRAGVEGADARLAAAQHLKTQLEKILEGEPPYDLFVRWKPLRQQAIGWEPDINDGVRINIRPFLIAKPLNFRGKNVCILRSTPNVKWNKDRGKEPHRPKEEYPWFWSWDEKSEDFTGGNKFDGNRWNDLHYSRAFKLAARERRSKSPQEQD